ncbi:hypothetical protein VOLCADRAFT_107417 [Volvox carteri f. nagariensis]|uniref:Uncharacterized protein n=1 Tax=Volvox carteri f. nagariensis TaxID=3068 RepID=D8UDW8_VOLCA|nr:uncharacterized protein VOLCADRAFT_107417 [Volvox carteri f. nagariensis]EFJ42164.1 hypothetical protein VOLCADRAFT_107417 [Volvox carteri f. nagariensis]|eukprot:XP_002956861.1 hypothetical protein VOLCADRAFT_107417 [Volvox carteri f. nagariensis]
MEPAGVPDWLPQMELLFGSGGDAALVPARGELLPPLVQAPPFSALGAGAFAAGGASAAASEAVLAAVRSAYLEHDISKALAASLPYIAHPLLTLFPRAPAWPDVSLPSAVVEPTPPPPGGREYDVGWQVVELAAAATAAPDGSSSSSTAAAAAGRIDSLALQRRLAARGGGTDSNWRGLSVSLPYMPGGGVAVLAPSGPAAAEAASGLWLAQLEAGLDRPMGLPLVAAPGLGTGLFGGWAAAAAGEGAFDGTAAAAATSALPLQRTAGVLQPLPLTTPAGERIKPLAEALQGGGGAAAAIAGSQLGGEGTAATGSGSRSRAIAGTFADLWLEPELAAVSEVEEHGEDAAEGAGTDGTARRRGGGSGGVLAELETRTAAAEAEGDGRLAEVLAAAAAAATARLPPTATKGLPGGPTPDHPFAARHSIRNVDEEFEKLRPRLALHYPFELDTFQKEAVLHLEAGRSVFVAAHTSAGKTVVAEYAFALATQHCTRAVYTSPIKTISNQKFRDFSSKFEVGLLTGDVQVRPTAPCLIMTTEILRSMLYKGADLIRDVEVVVFDEVHYVNDVDRGVVWEEVIIMLPPHITLVLLSATVPNVMDFADWVGRTKRKVIHVTGARARTTKRPVPLEHSLYYGGEIYPICSREVFNPEGLRATRGGGPNRGGPGGGGGFRSERQQLLELVGVLGKRAMLPVAVFCFSKKRCDICADALSSLDLATGSEKAAVHSFVDRCLARLKEGDRQLPQILRLRDMMRRGIAVHHAGLLPIMKEVVEMLFCQGYIKVLFCTETFAMGVNAPTRTVVFHSLRKHDGKNFRYLLPGEYTQMAGRAGRRGLDAVGHVLLACWDERELYGESELRTMLLGRGVKLESQFRLTYGMILNLLRVEDLKVEDMLKRSFAEFHAQRAAPAGAAELSDVERRLAAAAAAPWPATSLGCSREEVEEYADLCEQLEVLYAQLQDALVANKSFQQALVPGRLVLYGNPVNGLTEPAVVLGDAPAPAPPSSSTSPLTNKTTTTNNLTTATGNAVGTAATSAGSSSGLGLGIGTAAGSAASGDRRLFLLVLHRPGSMDEQHERQAEQERRSREGPAAGGGGGGGLSPAGFGGMTSLQSRKQQELDDMFGGMVKVGERMLNCRTIACVVHVPYVSYMYKRSIVGVCRARLRLDGADDILSCGGDWTANAVRRALASALRGAARAVDEAAADGGGGELPLLDPRVDFKIADVAAVQAMLARAALQSRRAALRPHRDPGLVEAFQLVRTHRQLSRRAAELRHQLSDASLQQLPEFEQRVAVLQRLGYLEADRSVTLKGRVCCEIQSTQDELVATEAVFSGLLGELSPEEAVALLSALVFQEKSEVEPRLPPSLASARDSLTALTASLAGIQREGGLDVVPEQHVAEVLHCGLMEVVYEWARGTPFSAITELTDVMEGSVVRAMVRLDGACRELQDAARVMGNTALFQLMQAASAAIKRDVIFAASLSTLAQNPTYLTYQPTYLTLTNCTHGNVILGWVNSLFTVNVTSYSQCYSHQWPRLTDLAPPLLPLYCWLPWYHLLKVNYSPPRTTYNNMIALPPSGSPPPAWGLLPASLRYA